MIYEQFEEIASLCPQKIAVIDDNSKITYGQLNDAATQMANELCQLGVKVGEPVILVADRSVKTIIGILGIIRSGAVYVPIEIDNDPHLLSKRVKQMGNPIVLAATSRVATLQLDLGTRLIYVESYSQSLSKRYDFMNDCKLNSNSHLYILFTSGSTGEPKGVVISHGNLQHYINSIIGHFSIESPFNYATISSFATDFGNTIMYLSLLTGGSLYIMNRYLQHDPKQFQLYLVNNNIDVLKITPSHFNALFKHLFFSKQYLLKCLIFGGEKLNRNIISYAFAKKLAEQLYNHYGPTETTIGACYYKINKKITKSQTIPIGNSIGKTELLLMDNSSKPISGLGEGELFIGGPGVGQGYYNNPDETQKKFVHIIDEEGLVKKYYRTGDICFRHDDGNLEFVGRRDREVKIRGYRINLEAVENTLLSIKGINGAAVFALVDNLSLIAAITLTKDNNSHIDLNEKAILTEIKLILPSYMVPDTLFILEKFPTTPTGKINYAELRDLKKNLSNQCASSSDMTVTEVILRTWQEYLNVTHINPKKDDFYSLGGNSISAIQVISDLQSKGLNVTAQLFFDSMTVNDLVQSLSAKKEEIAISKYIFELENDFLSPIQKWFFSQNFIDQNHWNQAVILRVEDPTVFDYLLRAIRILLTKHSLLRTSFSIDTSPKLIELDKINYNELVCTTDISHLSKFQQDAHIQFIANSAHNNININTGDLIKFHLFKNNQDCDELLIICHHIAIDGISWRILLDELTRFYHAVLMGKEINILDKVDNSFWRWNKELYNRKYLNEFSNEVNYWSKFYENLQSQNISSLPVDLSYDANDEGSSATVWICFTEQETHRLLRHAADIEAAVPDILLSSLVNSLNNKYKFNNYIVDIENHGRESIHKNVDISGTIGWFTSLFPVLIQVQNQDTYKDIIEAVKEVIANIPYKGVGWGVFSADNKINITSEILFNYLGEFKFNHNLSLKLVPSNRYIGPTRGSKNDRIYKLKFTGRII